jgi:hypothetical protein
MLETLNKKIKNKNKYKNKYKNKKVLDTCSVFFYLK